MHLSNGPSAATNSPVVHTVLMAVQPSFDLVPEEPRKRYEEIGRVVAIILIKTKLSKLSQLFVSNRYKDWISLLYRPFYTCSARWEREKVLVSSICACT